MLSSSNRVFGVLLALLTVGGLAGGGLAASGYLTAGPTRAAGIAPAAVKISGTAVKTNPAAVEAAVAAWQDCSGGYVAITFDDGPDPVTTPQVLDALRREHIRATFFVIGNNVRKNPQLVRREVSEGHSVQNHTVDHPDLATLSVTEAVNRLALASKDITAAGLPAPTFYRPPFNHTTPEISGAAAATLGLTEVGFTTNTDDWTDPGVDAIVQRAATVKPAGIIQMHDRGHQQTIKAIAGIAADLRARHMCPGKLAVIDHRNPDAPSYQTFHAEAVAW